MTIAPMGLITTPEFFQHRMESLLNTFLWDFALVCIDDIIVFSGNKEEHLLNYDWVLTTLKACGVSLSIKKCQSGYPSVELLRHEVSRLEPSNFIQSQPPDPVLTASNPAPVSPVSPFSRSNSAMEIAPCRFPLLCKNIPCKAAVLVGYLGPPCFSVPRTPKSASLSQKSRRNFSLWSYSP